RARAVHDEQYIRRVLGHSGTDDLGMGDVDRTGYVTLRKCGRPAHTEKHATWVSRAPGFAHRPPTGLKRELRRTLRKRFLRSGGRYFGHGILHDTQILV